MNFSTVQKRVQELSKKARKPYQVERSINNYHLMQGKKYIVIDESLDVLYIVINAMIRDKTQLRGNKSC